MPALSTAQAARYQAAVQAIGQHIASLSAEISAERDRATPDEARIADLVDQREALTNEQEKLSPRDTTTIDRLMAEASA